jgi:hypothetical protein
MMQFIVIIDKVAVTKFHLNLISLIKQQNNLDKSLNVYNTCR